MQSFWKSHFLTFCLVTLDVLAMSLIWRGSWELRHALYPGRFLTPINAFDPSYSHALPILLLVWLATLGLFQQYAHRGKISSLNQAGDLIKASLALGVGTLAASHLLKGYDLGRAVILFAVAAIAFYLYVSRTLLRIFKESMRQRGVGLTRVAIIGAGETGRRVALRIQNHPEVGYELLGFIDRQLAELGPEVAGVSVIGDGSEMVDLLLRYRIEEVFLAIPSMSHDDVFNLVIQCEAANVHFKIVKNDLLEVITDRVKIDDIDDFPVILLREGHLTPLGSLCKRLLDLSIALPLGLLLLPVYAAIAILIRFDSRGKVIFQHERVGQDGVLFKLYKFRTMVADAHPTSVAPSDETDPRVTRFGRWLRKTSLDELPQVWNVIRGNMSMVGPRPEMAFIVEQYEPWQRRRLDVPQGITGLWQIAGRKKLPLHYNLEYDFYYIRNWSLLLDLVILMRTIPAVLLCKGAF
jgi:exopolysaccharide biosynthesis polyprenyl glycosylphosphotransferase